MTHERISDKPRKVSERTYQVNAMKKLGPTGLSLCFQCCKQNECPDSSILNEKETPGKRLAVLECNEFAFAKG